MWNNKLLELNEVLLHLFVAVRLRINALLTQHCGLWARLSFRQFMGILLNSGLGRVSYIYIYIYINLLVSDSINHQMVFISWYIQFKTESLMKAIELVAHDNETFYFKTLWFKHLTLHAFIDPTISGQSCQIMKRKMKSQGIKA